MDKPLPPSDAVDLMRVARLVRPFETLELRAAPRPDGGWSIGYGHVRSAREGAQVTEDEAEALLLYDLGNVASVVRRAIYAPIHRNQLEALIAFAFHIGIDSFLHSTTLHRFNAGDSLGAAQEMERWCRADLDGEAQVVDALVRRRAAEKAHFLTPPGGFPKASRALVRPQFEAWAIAPVADPTDAEPSAALAAADSVSARLRVLVPDVADEAEAPPSTIHPEPEVAPVAEPQTSHSEPMLATVAAAAAAPILFKAFTPAEPEIPPPPMPFEAASDLAEPYSAKEDVWPSIAPADHGADDPFAQGPVDTASIEAPSPEPLAPMASLFRAKPEPRAEIPPRSEPIRQASPSRTPGAGVPRSWLLACIALGLLIFIWAIWSIFTTNPGPINFAAGLFGIAVMAVPAYLLLGAPQK
jgi:lysozyme